MVCSIACRKNTIQKIEEQLVKAKIAENDPPLKFTNKTHKKYIYIMPTMKIEKAYRKNNYFVNHRNNIQKTCENNPTNTK